MCIQAQVLGSGSGGIPFGLGGGGVEAGKAKSQPGPTVGPDSPFLGFRFPYKPFKPRRAPFQFPGSLGSSHSSGFH